MRLHTEEEDRQQMETSRILDECGAVLRCQHVEIPGKLEQALEQNRILKRWRDEGIAPSEADLAGLPKKVRKRLQRIARERGEVLDA